MEAHERIHSRPEGDLATTRMAVMYKLTPRPESWKGIPDSQRPRRLVDPVPSLAAPLVRFAEPN